VNYTFKADPRQKVDISTPGPASKIICSIHLYTQKKKMESAAGSFKFRKTSKSSITPKG
jgi:hypothetical protein